MTESGTFTVPYTGWYYVWMIDGGSGSNIATYQITTGASGNTAEFLVKLIEGMDIPVTIGTGGSSSINNVSSSGTFISAGKTYFGNHETNNEMRFDFNTIAIVGASGLYIGLTGGGPGGGSPWSTNPKGRWWGSGGGTIYSTYDGGAKRVGDGKQGAILLRFHNPTKINNTETTS